MTSPDRMPCPVPHRPSYCKGALGGGRPGPRGCRTQDTPQSESGRASGQQLTSGRGHLLEWCPASPTQPELLEHLPCPTRDTGVAAATSTRLRDVSTLLSQDEGLMGFLGHKAPTRTVLGGPMVSLVHSLSWSPGGCLRKSGQISKGQNRNSACLVFLFPGSHPHRTPGATLAAAAGSKVKPFPLLLAALCT